MNIMTATTKKSRSTVSQQAMTTIYEFDKAYDVQKLDFEAGRKAWRRYFPVDHGKWDPEALKVMEEELRHPVQFDVASPRVDTLAGSLVADLPDPDWVPVYGTKNILSEAVAQSYYTDKDLYNYDDVMLKVFRDGLVHCGDLEIYEDYKYHTPHVAIGRVMYGFLVWEPYWISDDDRDANVCYRVAYMTADKLVKKYKHATDELIREIRDYKKDMSNYPFDIKHEQQELRWGRVGDEFQVIEKHYLEHIKTTRLIGRQEGMSQWIPFPINKERAYLEQFAEANKIDWTTVIEDAYEDKVHYVTTVVRELGNAEIQIGAKSKIQVNGLPFHHFTTSRWAGRNMGIVASLEGVEDTINKRESLITELISKANGGSTLVDKDLFLNPKDRQEWVKKKNKPGHAEFVDLSNSKNPILRIADNGYPSAVVDQINRMYDKVLPIVSRVSDAMASSSDSQDSGILFERKFQVNMIANTLMNRNMRQLINNMAESYFYQWQITYADQEKELTFRDGKTTITLNKHENGMIYNDVKSVPRCRIVITESTKSQTYQMRWRSVWAEMLQSINPQVAPAHYNLALKNMFETLQTKDEDKEAVKVINELTMMISRLQLAAQATGFQAQAQGNTLQSMQIDMQIQQMMSQLNQQFQQAPPSGHMEAPAPEQQVQYPEPQQPQNSEQASVTPEQGTTPGPSEDKGMNPSPTEAVSEGMPTPPPLSGGIQ
jgi:hypothetical protein